MSDAGWGAASLGGGFAKGFANAYLMNHQEKIQKQRRDEDKKLEEFQLLNPIRMKAAEEAGDWQGYQDWLTGYFPNLAKETKKNGSPFDAIAPILEPAKSGMPAGSTVSQGGSEVAMTATGSAPSPLWKPTTTQPTDGVPSPLPAGMPQPGPAGNALASIDVSQQPLLPSRPAVGPGTTGSRPDVNPKSMLFGTPMPTRAQREAQQIDLTQRTEAAKLNAGTDAKLAAAKRLRDIDPSMSVEESLIAVGMKVPQDQFGVVPTGGGIFNKRTGSITEPPSAKAGGNMPGAMGQRFLEFKALHPDWSDDQIKTAAAKSIEEDRSTDRMTRQAAQESIAANRSLQKTLLDMQVSQGGITPNNAAGLTTGLRRDWNKAVQPFRDRQVAISKLQSAITPDASGKTMIQRDRNAATQDIVMSFNKLLDEHSTVREGEYARSEELTPLTTWLEAKLAAIQAGGGKMTDDQLLSLAKEGMNIANKTAEIHEAGLRDMRTAMSGQLRRYNLPEADVFGTSKLGANLATVTINGKTFTGTQEQIDAYTRALKQQSGKK